MSAQTQINQLAAVLTTRQTADRDLAGVYMVIRECGQAGIGLDEISRQIQIAETAEGTVDVPLIAVDEIISAQAVTDVIGLGIVARTDDGKYQATSHQNAYLPDSLPDTDPSQSLDRETLDQEETLDQDALRREIVALPSQHTEGLDVDEVFAQLSQRDIDVAWEIFNLVVHELAAQGVLRQTEEGNLVTVLQP